MTETGKEKLVDEQALAAYTLDRHISVTAGPGAGKTAVLVERYLQVLSTADVSVDQIVAITFTNRAANEMRERLRRELDNLIAHAQGQERSRWLHNKRRLESAIITTIHGFCAGLLKEYPVEAEVDPEFILLEEYQTALLEEAAAEEVLTEAIHSEDQSIIALTSGVGRPQLAGALIEIYRRIRSFGVDYSELIKATAANHQPDSGYYSVLEQLESAMRQFIARRGLTRTASDRQDAAARQWPGVRTMLRAGPDSIPVAEFCGVLENFREDARPSASGDIAQLTRELDELLLKADFSGLIPQLWFDHHAGNYAISLASAVRRVEERLNQRKRKLSALDFDDLQLLVLDLFRRHPETARRIARRFRFFLVDEFQDTNEVQRQLLRALVLDQPEGRSGRANLFIVGDRKQSVYGFRGADVKVFAETSRDVERLGGLALPLQLNFRSQPPLIHFFNYLFPRVFAVEAEFEENELAELGYVEHEPSIPHRESEDPVPLVELLVDTGDDEGEAAQSPRERDARQMALRIADLAAGGRGSLQDLPPVRRFRYGDIAVLFRAMSEVPIYEAELRRMGIPYQTVQGKGFYDRQEISDLVQLLRFLENTTDDLALAAVLRSPLAGVSDNALLALRLGPPELEDPRTGKSEWMNAGLFFAIRRHRRVESIDDQDRAALDRAVELIEDLVGRRNRCGVAELLRYVIDRSEYRVIAASSFDGAARLANIEKLCLLAERFELNQPATIRDFVRFIRDFEEVSGREGEGRIDSSADAVILMTVHQAKGLQFPVVFIPEQNRSLQVQTEWFIVDRHRGLSLKIPDGRAGLVAGHTYIRLRERARLREKFESMRLFYVAATRARDRLILSGAVRNRSELESTRETWLGWVFQSLGLSQTVSTRMVTAAENVSYWLGVNLGREGRRSMLTTARETVPGAAAFRIPGSTAELFPLLQSIRTGELVSSGRFSVTQLVNYRRCPRQYYFDRILRAPESDEVSVWSDTEAPEPPANLNATLRGSVIHRFCERYDPSLDTDSLLSDCFDEIITEQRRELADRIAGIDREKALGELRRLAENYISSDARARIDAVRQRSAANQSDGDPSGVYSERKFRLKLPQGILFGTIDKLLISRGAIGDSLEVEVLDFKTNRVRAGGGDLKQQIEQLASEYALQMQAYSIAVRRLLPGPPKITATLHFLDPNIEFRLEEEVLDGEISEKAVNEAMAGVASSFSVEDFPARTDRHCRLCNFVGVCRAGREWLRSRPLSDERTGGFA